MVFCFTVCTRGVALLFYHTCGKKVVEIDVFLSLPFLPGVSPCLFPITRGKDSKD